MVTIRSWFCLVFFAVFWLLPLGWQGLLHRRLPGLPPLLAQTTNVSCLFVKGDSYYPAPYIQVLTSGATEWVTEDDSRYLRMSPFGHRTRFDEMLRKKLDNPRALQELSTYVRHRHLRVTGKDVLAVRFVTGIVLLGTVPASHFRKPPLLDLPPRLREVWYTLVFAPVPPDLLRRPA